mgnify:CR=1 FL=1
MPAALHGPAGPSTPRARGNCHHTKRRTRGAGGAPGMVRDGACPNLLQRRSGLGSTTEESAEYQRFFSCISARPGPLQQIWTTRAAAGPGRGAASRTTTTAASRSAGRAHENVHQGLVLAGRGVWPRAPPGIGSVFRSREGGSDRCSRERGGHLGEKGADRIRRGAVPAPHSIPLADRPAWWGSVSHVVTRSLCLDHLRAVGPLMFRWTTVFREPGGPTEHKWSKQKSAAMSPLATLRPAPASPSYEY